MIRCGALVFRGQVSDFAHVMVDGKVHNERPHLDNCDENASGGGAERDLHQTIRCGSFECDLTRAKPVMASLTLQDLAADLLEA